MSRQTRRPAHSLRFRGACRQQASRSRLGPLNRRLGLELLEDRRLLALVTVTNTFDVANGNTTSIAALIAANGGDGISLREAIQAANATAGADEVRFAAALSGATITLGGTELAISEALTVDARPLTANVTINVINLQSRIFNITATTGDFTLGGLTLTGGTTSAGGAAGGGGAIRSLTRSSLTLIESTVSGSRTIGSGAYGGGIFAYGPVTLTQSTVSGNSTTGQDADGGGIWNFGPLMLSQSTVSGNSTAGNSAAGGGIWNYGSVTLNESTVSGNSTAGSSSYGGGIIAVLSPVTLTNSTVSGNRTTGADADGGGIFGGGAVTITQSTVTVNQATHATALGGGVFQSNLPSNFPFSIAGSILAGNTAGGGGADLFKDPNSTLTVNYSLIGTGIAPNSGGNNVVTNTPQLGVLADNGGLTQTHTLLASSLAIDAGDPSIVFSPAQFDQRGAPFVRVFDGDGAGGARVDIGAYERQAVNLIVDTLADENDGNYSAGDLSLREAIGLANDNVGPDTITFAAALSGTTITLGGTELAITEELTIDARPLAANVTVDANQLSRIFNITATTGDFTLAGLTLRGGRTTADGLAAGGGAIRASSPVNLTLDQSTVSGNSTAGSGANGGGIFSIGRVDLIESAVSGNSTTGTDAAGGGIMAGTINGQVTLTQSTVSGNSTAGSGAHGGGIFAYYTVTLTQSIVSGNSTAGYNADGGGIFARHGEVTLTQSTVSGNSTAETRADGGGVSAVTVMLTQSTVSGNSTAGGIAHGGGILASTVTLTQSTVSGNSTAGNGANGGGIRASTVRLIHSTVTDNHAMHVMSTGGGVSQVDSSSNSPFSISGSIVAGNTAGGGGADLVKDPQSTLIVNYSAIGVIDGLPIFTGNVGNLTGTASFPFNPQLGPLANNGGPTQTHALLAGSPAINAGDPSFVGPPNYDQRGFSFARVVGGRIDMGAFESGSTSADFDLDLDVDGFDFLAWQRGFGAAGDAAAPANGNADVDLDVDGGDLAVWKSQFGSAALVAAGAPAASAALVAGDAPSRLSPQAVDAALARLMAAEAPASWPLFRPRWLRAR